jgi:hypothetical protein
VGTQGYAAPEYVATGRLYLSVNHSIGLTLSIGYILERERDFFNTLANQEEQKQKETRKRNQSHTRSHATAILNNCIVFILFVLFG